MRLYQYVDLYVCLLKHVRAQCSLQVYVLHTHRQNSIKFKLFTYKSWREYDFTTYVAH
jgi:hypothetical protein